MHCSIDYSPALRGRFFLFALFGVAIALLLASCAGNRIVSERSRAPQAGSLGGTTGKPLPGAGQVPAGETPKVALLLPMTGKFAKLGTAMRQAAELALFDIAGKGFVLTPIDTGGTPEGAAEAAKKAKDGGAHLILGPLLSASVKAVRTEMEGTGINIVAFSTDAAVAGGNVYLLGFHVKPQIDRIVTYAVTQKLTRIAVLAPEGAYGEAVLEAFKEAAKTNNVAVSGSVLYPSDSTEMSKALRTFTEYNIRAGRLNREIAKTRGRTDAAARRARAKAKRSIKVKPPTWDAVIIADGGARLLLAASLLAYFDVNPDKVQYLGTGQWDDRMVSAEPNLKGAWFAAPPPGARTKFEDKFKAQFRTQPPRIATLAYDAVALAAVLARAEGGANFGAVALTSANGFVGIDGIFRFQQSGLSERGLAVLEVAEGEFRMIGTAPSTFVVATE